MKILICGGRDYQDYDRLKLFLDRAYNFYRFSLIIEGGARGADFLARQWGNENGIEMMTFPADWKTHGKKAGMIRNQQMLDEGQPDVVIAFPGGNGTADMINRAKEKKIPVIQVHG